MPQYFLNLEPDSDFVICRRLTDYPGPTLIPPSEPGRYVLLTGSWTAEPMPTPTSRRKLVGEDVVWVETGTMAQLIAAGIDRVDTAADAVRAAVIQKQTQTEEYKFAEQDARAYRAAGYTGPVGRGVTSWQNAKWRDGWTAREACDDILATADRWITLLYDIRGLRLNAKENMRHAANGDDITAYADDCLLDLQTAMMELANA